MNSIKIGKKIVIAIIVVLLLINLISTISMMVYGKSDEIAATAFFGLVRLAVIGTILYYLYSRNKIAKWLIVIVTLYYGISGFLSTLISFNTSLNAIGMINLVINIIYITIGVELIVSRHVNNFLRSRDGEYQEESNDYESES